MTPPDCYLELVTDLSKKEQKALEKYTLNPVNTDNQKAANKVMAKLKEKRESFTADEMAEFTQWGTDVDTVCGFHVGA